MFSDNKKDKQMMENQSSQNIYHKAQKLLETLIAKAILE